MAEQNKTPKGDQITPFYVAVQACERIRDLFVLGPNGGPPKRALDPSAGSGVWCRAMRSVFPGVHVTAIEPQERHQGSLRQVADRVIVDEFQPDRLAGEQFDIIATNPPFSGTEHFVAGVYKNNLLREPCENIAASPHRKDLGGVLVLLHYLSFASRSENMEILVKKISPTYQMNIPGHLIFVPNTRGDSRSYGHFVWTQKTTGPTWVVENLPRLPSQLRRHPTRYELQRLESRQAIEGCDAR